MWRFLLTEPITNPGLDLLRAAGEVHQAPSIDEPALCEAVKGMHAVIVRAARISQKVIEAGQELKVIGKHGVGVDNIDLQAATRRGIQVVNTPGANAEAVAEHAVALMMDLSRQIALAHNELRRGNYAIKQDITGRELRGATLGVVGFGHIGQRVAEICHAAFQMTILYTDVRSVPDAERALGAQRVSLEQLLSRAEYVTLHLPLLPETRHLLDERALSLMRADAVLINTSRGGVIDEATLYRFLAEGRIAGAALDVFEQEPLPPSSPLLELDNIVLTPHVAGTTRQALAKMSLVAEDVLRVLRGETPLHPANAVGA